MDRLINDSHMKSIHRASEDFTVLLWSRLHYHMNVENSSEYEFRFYSLNTVTLLHMAERPVSYFREVNR